MDHLLEVSQAVLSSDAGMQAFPYQSIECNFLGISLRNSMRESDFSTFHLVWHTRLTHVYIVRMNSEKARVSFDVRSHFVPFPDHVVLAFLTM
jgi:hypothetical protein